MTRPISWSLLALLRFVLASIVAFAHITDFERDPFAIFIASFGAKAAVVGFLVVSGVSIAASLERDPTGFYFRRFKRIYPIYFFAVLFGISLEYWLGDLKTPFYAFQPSGSLSAIGSLLMLQTVLVKSIAYNPIIWSLAVECAFYVIAPFIWKRPAAVCALCAVSAVFYLLPHGDHGTLYSVALKANAVKYFWPFGFGLMLYRFKSSLCYGAGLALGAALVFASPINFEPHAVATYLASVAVIWIAQTWPARSRALDYLGDLSYPLYLFQFPVFVGLYATFSATSALILFPAALIASVFAFELIDVRLKPRLFAFATRRNAAVTATG